MYMVLITDRFCWSVELIAGVPNRKSPAVSGTITAAMQPDRTKLKSNSPQIENVDIFMESPVVGKSDSAYSLTKVS
jgi:hypothetical protein